MGSVTVVYQPIDARTVARMAAPALERFDAVASRMPQIAQAVDAFTDPTLRERAFYELLSILNPDSDDDSDPAVGEMAGILMAEAHPGETPSQTTLRLLRSRTPDWAMSVLDAYLTGQALDFTGVPVPVEVRHRLNAAQEAGALTGGHRVTHDGGVC